ncbi:uncharacterized protein N0V89_012093 [Didymosphaeria variabile]|uniref:RNase III domain-containing protein n=1 Tax=Didymosphaeria variabile TaxID=1932322 RepID=A0A9W9C446_9PLEO|nr:uncharacterized protein N0V89_012093 [Didymosphaeria variabile]KAJ4344353.1 hypothetical protein N0V89_012093 [Didymosphaeria variabile]
MVDYVQEAIGYRFSDCEPLRVALKAAHRSEEAEKSDDGNRGLAKIGTSVIDMVETHDIVMTKGKTKTNALSAIVGAVWLDLEEQGERTVTARTKVFNILRHIDSVMADRVQGTLATADEGTALIPEENHGHQLYEGVSHFAASDVTVSRDAITMDAFMPQHFSESQQDMFGGMFEGLLPLHDITLDSNSLSLDAIHVYMHIQDNLNALPSEGEVDFDNTALPQLDEAFQHSEGRFWIENEGLSDAVQASSGGVEHAQPKFLRKRKQAHSNDETYEDNPAYCSLLRTERQKLATLSVSDRVSAERYLDYPHNDEASQNHTQVMQLRSLYLGIGTCGTLADFKELLRVARQRKVSYPHHIGPTLNITECFNEICRLDNEEALCVLTRRYHIIKFCAIEQEVFRQSNFIAIETSSTFEIARKARRGNPIVLQEAATTAALTSIIQPGLGQETKEFKRLCDKVKRLRKLARNLQMLTSVYGFGILALIPSGPSYQDLSLTDTALRSVAEPSFKRFTELLYQQQGLFLKPLSQAVQPALIALVTGCLSSQNLFPIEQMDMRTVERLPKGSLDLFEHLRSTNSGN